MLRTMALLIGILLSIGGIAGFLLVNGTGLLLGIFEVNPPHNAVHLIVGAAPRRWVPG